MDISMDNFRLFDASKGCIQYFKATNEDIMTMIRQDVLRTWNVTHPLVKGFTDNELCVKRILVNVKKQNRNEFISDAIIATGYIEGTYNCDVCNKRVEIGKFGCTISGNEVLNLNPNIRECKHAHVVISVPLVASNKLVCGQCGWRDENMLKLPGFLLDILAYDKISAMNSEYKRKNICKFEYERCMNICQSKGLNLDVTAIVIEKVLESIRCKKY